MLLQCEQLSSVGSRKIVSKRFANNNDLDGLIKNLEKVNKISSSLLSARLDQSIRMLDEKVALIFIINGYEEQLYVKNATCSLVKGLAYSLLMILIGMERSIKYSKILMNIKVILYSFSFYLGW